MAASPAYERYNDMLARTNRTVSAPPTTGPRPRSSLAGDYNARRKGGRPFGPQPQSSTYAPSARGGGPLTQHVNEAKAAGGQGYDRYSGGYPNTNDGSGVDSGNPSNPQTGGIPPDQRYVDEGDPNIPTTAVGREQGGPMLPAGTQFKYNPTTQNWEQPPTQPVPAHPLGPTLAPRQVSVGPHGPQISPMQLAPGQTVPPPGSSLANPYVGMSTEQLMNVPIQGQSQQASAPAPTSPAYKAWLADSNGGTIAPGESSKFPTGQGTVSVQRGIPAEEGTTTADTTFGPGGKVADTGSSYTNDKGRVIQTGGQSDFLKNMKGRVSDADLNSLTQYAAQGATPEQLNTAANQDINRQTEAQRYTNSQAALASREQMDAARERITTLRGKQRGLQSAYNRAANEFSKNFPGAQPNGNGQIVNPDGSVDTDATAAWKSVSDAQNAIAPIDQQLDSELKSFGQAPAAVSVPGKDATHTPNMMTASLVNSLGPPQQYQPNMQMTVGMRIQTSKGIFTVTGFDAQGQPQFEAAQQ
jgi:hypothetical protein